MVRDGKEGEEEKREGLRGLGLVFFFCSGAEIRIVTLHTSVLSEKLIEPLRTTLWLGP